MRKETGIAGATLLYGPQQSAPDLLAAMQALVDDLRADGRRIGGLRFSAGSLRLRADPWDMVMTLADGALPVAALGGVLRPPPPPDAPDFAAVHLAWTLRRHRHALGFLLRRRGAPPPEAALALAREGQLCLLALLRAVPPAVLVWHPGGLVLTPDELRAADPALLAAPPPQAPRLTLGRADRAPRPRPPTPRLVQEPPPAADPAPPDPPAATPVPPPDRAGFDRASDRITRALRQRAPAKAGQHPLWRPALTAVVLLWATLVPLLVGNLPGTL